MVKQKPIKVYNEVFKVYTGSNEEIKKALGITNEYDYCGLVNKAKYTIYICKDMTDRQQHKTLFHELIHAYFWIKLPIVNEIKEDYDREEFLTTLIESNIDEFIKLRNIANNYSFRE